VKAETASSFNCRAVLVRAHELGGLRGQDLVRAENVEDEDGVMGHEGPARLRDDVRVRHVLGRAGLADFRDDVARVFGERVVDRGMEVGLAAVVVDPQTSSAVDDAHVRAHHVQLDEDARGLAHGVADRADGGDLGPDMEVEELKTVQHPFLLEPLHRLHHLPGGEPELRAVTGGLDPFPGALGGQSGPHADDGAHIEIARAADDGIDFLRAVDGDDDLAAQLLGEEGGLDEGLVLVAVAENVAVGVLMEGEGDQEFGLAAGFDAEAVGGAVFDQLLHHVPLLVDLDRVDPAEPALVVVLRDGRGEGSKELLDPELQDVGETDEKGKVAAPALQILHQFLEVDRPFARAPGRHLDVARVVDGEEILAPSVDVVELGRVLDGPSPKVCLLSQLFMSSYATPDEISPSLPFTGIEARGL
jgi:hypothetical protein